MFFNIANILVNKGVIYLGDVSGNLASITTSGEVKIAGTISASASISGQPVQISGQTVIANVVTNISGQTVFLPNNGVNNVVQISGQTVVGSFTASVSGQAVLISGQTVTVANAVSTGVSGQTIYLVNDGVNNVVKVSGQRIQSIVYGDNNNAAFVLSDVTSDTADVNTPPLAVAGFGYGYNAGANSWARLRTTASGDGFRLIVSVSGQPVTANVTSNVSGNAIRVSGQSIYLVDDSINNKVKISGQLVVVSGIVAVNSLPVISISGNMVSISGQPITANVTTNISGQFVIIDAVDSSVVIKDANGQSWELFDIDTDNLPQTLVAGLVLNANYGYNESTSGYSRLRVTASGDGYRLITSVSGQPIRTSVSGNMVSISGQPVTANSQISGQTIYTVSGQNEVHVTNTLGINPVPVRLDPNNTHTVALRDAPGNVAAFIPATTDTVEPTDSYIPNAALAHGYDANANKWARLRTTASGDGFRLIVSISGQPVTTSVTTNISGNSVRLPNDGVNNVVSISGQTVIANVVTNISGNHVSVSGIVAVNSLPVISVSGNMVSISGQPVTANVTTNISGQTVYFVSGKNYVQIVNVNTDPVITTPDGGALYKVGFTVAGVGVDNVVQISGQSVRLPNDGVNNVVWISGQVVTATLNPGPTNISGQVIYFVDNGVNNVVKISGQLVVVSGIVAVNSLPVISTSGNAALISGQLVAVSGIVNIGNSLTIATLPVISVSGNVVNVSGNTVSVSGIVQPRVPTAGRTRPLLQCTSLSGGTVLLSGDVKTATLVNAGTSGTVMFVGFATDPPFSGKGIYLTAGNGYTAEIDNFNRFQVFAATSGQFLSYGGTQY